MAASPFLQPDREQAIARRGPGALLTVLCGCAASICAAEEVGTPAATPLNAPDLPNPGLALLRVLGALAIVLAVFWLGVWLYRNWQRFFLRTGTPRLQVLEARPLGGRQMLYVVAYEQERLLLASSPQGVTLLTHLPPGREETAPVGTSAAAPARVTAPGFLHLLNRALHRP